MHLTYYYVLHVIRKNNNNLGPTATSSYSHRDDTPFRRTKPGGPRAYNLRPVRPDRPVDLESFSWFRCGTASFSPAAQQAGHIARRDEIDRFHKYTSRCTTHPNPKAPDPEPEEDRKKRSSNPGASAGKDRSAEAGKNETKEEKKAISERTEDKIYRLKALAAGRRKKPGATEGETLCDAHKVNKTMSKHNNGESSNVNTAIWLSL
uniref:Uncharacterized protein n=1 Tax=Anopheles albimanus TaxID=7167 RepID=A0A182F2N5_ANOAL